MLKWIDTISIYGRSMNFTHAQFCKNNKKEIGLMAYFQSKRASSSLLNHSSIFQTNLFNTFLFSVTKLSYSE